MKVLNSLQNYYFVCKCTSEILLFVHSNFNHKNNLLTLNLYFL